VSGSEERHRDASAQSARVAARASAAGRVRATRTLHTHRLAEGIAVEASIMARLLRWRVLTLDASVMVVPANPRAADAGLTRRRGPATRGRLSEAVKNIDQAEQELARARQTNHVAVPQPR
jgi:hypothetical protein